MKSIDEMKLRELELWLEFVSNGVKNAKDAEEEAHVIRKRGWFCVAEFEHEDFQKLSDLLHEYDSNAGFAVHGRDAEDQAEIIEELHGNGHEIVFHGHRHHKFSDLSYDRAYDYISTGLESVEDATGITPKGLFTPMSKTSEGALQALGDLGFEWVVGTTDAESIPEQITILNPETPYDDYLFERGDSPTEVFEQFRERADDGSTFVFHPPYHVHYDATDEFDRWIADVRPVSVSEQVEDGGVGVVLDCIRPMKLA